MNSSVDTESAFCPERELWFEVLRRALTEWDVIFLKQKGLLGVPSDSERNWIKADLRRFFFEVRPVECNLSWICKNVAHDEDSLRRYVNHALKHGISTRKSRKNYTRIYD
jgi:hypothetical protein